MTSTAVIALGTDRSRRAAARLLADDGVGLVELLIALLVLNIGIFATLAAFSSGTLALRRASQVSTASAIADNYMECFRDVPYTDITWPLSATTLPAGSICATQPAAGKSYATVTGPDSRKYNVTATIQDGSDAAFAGSNNVKVVALTISDYAAPSTVLVKSSSTFSRCAQDMTPTVCQS